MPTDTPAPLPRLTAFAGQRNVAAGALHAVAQSLTALVTRAPDAQILIVDDASGSQVDLNLHGSLAQVLQRLPRVAAQAMQVPAPAPARMAGRPKLGVVAREITLLPRHWAWLATQPSGASVALRKRVEHAQRGSKAQDEQRQARDAAYQSRPTSSCARWPAMPPGFEEASRALFAGLLACVQEWPDDVRTHVLQLAERGWPDA